MKKIIISLFLAAAVLAASPLDALAFNVPDGPSNFQTYPVDTLERNAAQMKTHGWLTLYTIQALRNDGYGHIADTISRPDNLQALFNGLRAADYQWGSITEVGVPGIFTTGFSKGGLHHYYNPTAPRSRRGYTDEIIFYDGTLLDRVLDAVLTTDEYMLRGPQPAADRVADWYYAKAVEAMRAGRCGEAYFNLGFVIHLIQDISIPHHAVRNTMGVQLYHQAYEDAADVLLANESRRESLLGGVHGLYIPWMPVSSFMDSMAGVAARYIEDVSTDFSEARALYYEDALEPLLGLAVSHGAGILQKFYENWPTEAYSAVRLTVNWADALDDPDTFQAELFTTLNIIEPGETTGYHYDFHNEDFVTGFAIGDLSSETRDFVDALCLGIPVWQFPYSSGYVRSATSADMILALWDDDGTNHWVDDDELWLPPDWLDINPDSGVSRLPIMVDFITGQVYRITGSGSALIPIGTAGSSITSQGDNRRETGGRGQINFTVETAYVPEAAERTYNRAPLPPRNIFPGTAERPVSGVARPTIFYASTFTDPDGDTQRDSQWRLMDHLGNILNTSNGGAANLHYCTYSLTPSTTYKWQVRYQDSQGAWSEWSSPTTFTTNRPPGAPRAVSPEHNAVGVSVTPHLAASAYFDSEGQPHMSSEWQVLAYGTGGEPGRVIYSNSTPARVEYDIPASAELDTNTLYYWRVRYRDNCGDWSEWSLPNMFRTRLATLEHPQVSPMPPATIPIPTAASPVPATPASVSVKVTRPERGETWNAGETKSISWQTTGTGISSIGLYYTLDGGLSMHIISLSEANDGIYNWTVPDNPSSNAVIRVMAYGAKGETLALGDSGPFVLAGKEVPGPAAVQLISPAGGEYWFTGSSYKISWKSSGSPISYIEISYSIDGGKTWLLISGKEPDDGIFSWTVPDTPSGTALIRITARDAKGQPLASAQSGKPFTILRGQQ